MSYRDRHVDDGVQPQNPELVAKDVKLNYALGNHVAPLGPTFAESAELRNQFAQGLYWRARFLERRLFSGDKVVFVPFVDSKLSVIRSTC